MKKVATRFARRRMEKEYPAPALVVTSDVQQSTRDEARARGATNLLNIPLNEDTLRITIEEYLEPREGVG